jgi:hypothetical protein
MQLRPILVVKNQDAGDVSKNLNRINGFVWQRHVQNITKQSSGLLILKLIKSDDEI